MSYELLPEHPQGSPAWHKAREAGLGASEVAAILGLSPWQTPLSVWRTKQGVPNEIPEDLAYFGHALEPVIAQWIRDKHPEVGLVSDGLSARSVDHPWLTATPDRIAYSPLDGDEPPFDYVPVELKTSSAYSRSSWDDGVPDYYKIQSLVQQGILGADHGWLAVLHGGNSPELYRIDFDPAVWEQIVRITGDWWQTHIVEGVMPDPVSIAEQNELWPSQPGVESELSEQAFEVLERRNVLLSDIKAQKAEADALQLILGDYVKDAETLTYEGRKVATYKTQQGKAGIDTRRLKAEHPDIYEALSTRGAPFKVLRTVKERTND